MLFAGRMPEPNKRNFVREDIMSSAARRLVNPRTPESPSLRSQSKLARRPTILELGKQIIREEAAALTQLAARLDDEFVRAADMILACQGCVIIAGMGKAGLVGQKIAATLASTGTPSHFVHPAEALHGDLGRIRQNDLVICFSYSGSTEEVVQLGQAVRFRGVPVIAVTGRLPSALSELATTTIDLGPLDEAGDLGLAPSTTSTAMLALGDSLALVVSKRRGFAANDFARYHPGGSLGQKLSRVEEAMRPLEQCRIAFDDQTTRDVLVQVGQPGRRAGAVMLTDRSGRLSGIFTDSDLARLVENHQERALDRPIGNVMTHAPRFVLSGALIASAMEMMVDGKLSEIPVVDSCHAPIGMLDITDMMSLLPTDEEHPACRTGPVCEPRTLPFPKAETADPRREIGERCQPKLQN